MNSTKPKPFVFVVMPFSQKFDDVYKLAIKPACDDAGAYCERLDEQIFKESMLERIYNQIAKADFIIADMTERNPNVFYEVGYAHALGKTVILLTKNSSDIPFDLQHHFHIVYGDSIVNLKASLTPRVAYYIEHPGEVARQQENSFRLYIQGKPLADGSVYTFEREFSDDGTRQLVANIEVAGNNPGENSVEEITFMPVLITPKKFNEAKYSAGSGSTYIFQTITLPEEKALHRPLNWLTLQPGGWDSVTFGLRTPFSEEHFEQTESIEMTLRILGLGPPKDYCITAILSGPG